VRLTVTLLSVSVLLRLVLKGNNLLFLTLFVNSTFNRSTVNYRSTDLSVVSTDKDNLIKSYLVTFLSIKLFNIDRSTFFYLVLLTTSNDNCVHTLCTSLISQTRRTKQLNKL